MIFGLVLASVSSCDHLDPIRVKGFFVDNCNAPLQEKKLIVVFWGSNQNVFVVLMVSHT
jgi:hypothetical protein